GETRTLDRGPVRAALLLRTPTSKTKFVDVERADLRFERGARDAEARRRARWPVDAAAAGLQRLFDQLPLVTGECAGHRWPPFGDRPRGEPALVDGEFVSVADDHRPFDDVLQLAHVAGPGIGAQVIERPLVDAPDGLAGTPRVAVDEVL